LYSIDKKKRVLNHFCYSKALEYLHNAKIDLAHAYKGASIYFYPALF